MKVENARKKQMIEKQNATIVKLAMDNTELGNKQSSNDDDDVDEDMEAEIDRLKEVEAKLQGELGETHTKMEDERKLLKAENAALKSDAEALDNKVNELEEQLALLKDVKVELGTKNDDAEAQLESEKAKFEAKMNKLKLRVNDLTQTNTETEVAKLNAQKCSAEYEKRIHDMTSDQQLALGACEEYKKRIKELEDQLKALNLYYSELKEREDSAKTVIEDQQKTIQDLEDEQQMTQLAVEEYKKKEKELEDQLKVIKDETDLRNNELMQREDASNTVIEDQQKKIHDLEEQLRQANLEDEDNDEDSDGSHSNQSLSDLDIWLKTIKDSKKRYLSVDDIHNGYKILYGRLDFRTVVNVAKLENSSNSSMTWKLYSTETSEPFKMYLKEVIKRTRFKLNLICALVCNNENKLREIIHRIHSCTITSLTLSRQQLDEKEFLKLIPSVKAIKFDKLSVMKESGRKMRINEILKALPNIETFEYVFLQSIKTDTAENLSKLPRFKKLTEFKLFNCSNGFILEDFAEFIKKHPNVNFVLKHRTLDSSVLNQKKEEMNLPADCNLVF